MQRLKIYIQIYQHLVSQQIKKSSLLVLFCNSREVSSHTYIRIESDLRYKLFMQMFTQNSVLSIS